MVGYQNSWKFKFLVSELVVRSGEQDLCDLNSGNLGGQLENHTMTSCSSLNSK